MSRRPILAWAGALLLAGGAAGDTTKRPTADDVAKAEKAVRQELEKVKGGHGQFTRVEDDAVAKTFPGYVFFTVLFRQYPVAPVVPEGLKPSNVFAVGPDGKPQLINDQKAMEKFFTEHARVKDTFEEGRAAVRAWLRLSPELLQDGFYSFVIEDKSVTARIPMQGDSSAEGKAVVMRGGNGAVAVKMTFNTGAGKITSITQDSKIRPGPRPICQATKLLDPDPVVRRMAEQDLLIMGRAARPYLDEQRARAAPELRRAIDRLWQRIVDAERE